LLFYKPSSDKSVGFTASKKVGNATKRNFAKRRLRALFSDYNEKIKNGKYIFVAKSEIVAADFKNLKSDFEFALKRLNALKR
jgi:ribonuclease P protein component